MILTAAALFGFACGIVVGAVIATGKTARDLATISRALRQPSSRGRGYEAD